MIPKFDCIACGACCSNIRGLAKEKHFIEEFSRGKLPLIQLTSPEDMTFPLWDFEAKRFREYEKESRIDAKISPSRGVLDLNSGRFIIFTYQMHTKDACPFQSKDGKCLIYHTKRAFICHLFPFNRSPYLDIGQPDDKGMFGECCMLKGIIDNLEYTDKKALISQLSDSFGNTFLAALQHDFIIEWSNKLIIDMIKDKKIRPAMGYPYKFLKKRIESSDKVDLMDFLVDSEYLTSQEIKDLIDRFESFQDASRLKDKLFK